MRTFYGRYEIFRIRKLYPSICPNSNPASASMAKSLDSPCPGAVAHQEATEAHTWFPGYRWRLAFCRHCGRHFGWHYEAVSPPGRPVEFWGILISHLLSR